jgi:GDP-mannose 6-dehydrogenase
MRVSVFGLGYVGCVSVACLAREKHQVIGLDVIDEKVNAIANGVATVVEPGVDELLVEAKKIGRLSATKDAVAAVHSSDMSLICVGTPSGPDGSLIMNYVKETAQAIGRALKTKVGHHIVVLRSTVPPGTMENLIVPTILAESDRTLDEVGILIVPEFLREGTAVADYYDPPLAVVGSHDGQPDGNQGALAALLAVDPERLTWIPFRQAELLKSTCNVFHALKVAFANEIGSLCSSQQIDGRSLMRLLCQDRKLNISPAYLRPGMPFGGSCLPKDLSGVIALGMHAALDLPLLKAIAQSNAAHKVRAMDAARRVNGFRRIGMDGLAFKSGTDDLRESPMVEIAEHLIGKGYDLRILDPAVETARLTGANKTYIEKHVPHLADRLVGSEKELLDHAEAIILTRDDCSLLDLAAQLERPPLVVDLTGADRTSAFEQELALA